ncbi:glycosyltransferase family 2 protein [Holophaga foetida]|uniref:glycosyltransferase family 2 protein n=1 Tax=Holophaga foetida TaxID=35839 RepID=UPI00024721BE|nr:glycosyltransferase family 2 protein [Holophaga foetida]
MLELTVIIHTRDSEATLPRLLESVRWAEECIVVDMESRDRTCEIARQYGATLIPTPMAPRIDGIRNAFLERGQHEWVFVLDSDEYLAEDAEENVRGLLAQYGESCDAFFVPRYNMIAGQIIRSCSWYPDHQIRLFRKGCVRWGDTTHKLPELLTAPERLHKLEPPGCLHIHHENYTSIEQFIDRQVKYALNDIYPEDGFSFQQYVAKAYEEFFFRLDEKNDGELSFALATLMAWDRVVRGLIHWERLGRKDSLSRAYSLPIATISRYPDYVFPNDLEELRRRVQMLESAPGVKSWARIVKSFRRERRKVKEHLKRILHCFRK